MAMKKIKNIEESELDRKIKRNLKLYLPIVIFLVAIVSVFFIFSQIFSSFGKVKYDGLTFTKEKFGEIPVYHYAYYLSSPTGALVQYNLYIRNNPAENKVPVDGKIRFAAGNLVYIGIDGEGLSKCNQSSIALAGLSQFLTNNFIKIKSGVLDIKEAVAENLSYISCEGHPDNRVIKIKTGNATYITNKEVSNDDIKTCYTISVANCEVLPAVEKFIVQSIVDAKNATR